MTEQKQTLEFKQMVLDQVMSGINGSCNYIAFGDDNTAPTENDIALGNEFYRKARTDIELTSEYSIVSAWLTSIEANNEEIKEYGIFKQDTAGQMMLRATDNTINKNEFIEVWVDFKISYEIEINSDL